MNPIEKEDEKLDLKHIGNNSDEEVLEHEKRDLKELNLSIKN